MKKPRIPPMFAMIVQTGISAVDGLAFSGHSQCPACGGHLAGHDTKRKRFADLMIGNEEKTMYVSVRRFYCTTCHRLCYADEPFYYGTRIGSPVIDLCIALSMTMPVNRVSAYLAAMGILVDRTSCRLYVRNSNSNYVRNNVRYMETNNIFGIHLPHSIISLAALAARADEGRRIEGAEVLSACRFPSAHGAASNRLFLPEQRNEREKKENKEIWQARFP